MKFFEINFMEIIQKFLLINKLKDSRSSMQQIKFNSSDLSQIISLQDKYSICNRILDNYFHLKSFPRSLLLDFT